MGKEIRNIMVGREPLACIHTAPVKPAPPVSIAMAAIGEILRMVAPCLFATAIVLVTLALFA